MATPAFRSSTDGTANSPLNKSPNSSGAIAHGEDSGVPSARIGRRAHLDMRPWRGPARGEVRRTPLHADGLPDASKKLV